MLSHKDQVDLNINCTDWDGLSPLHLACQLIHEEIALRLIIAGGMLAKMRVY